MRSLNLNQVKLNWRKRTDLAAINQILQPKLNILFIVTLILLAGGWISYSWICQNSNVEELSAEISKLAQKIKISQQSAEKISKNTNITADKLELAKLEKDVLSIRKDEVNAKNAVYANISQALGGVFFFITAYFTWRNLKATEEKLITERISKAVEQLGSDKSQIVKGGIYSLERISQDSSKDYWTIVEILTSFIRGKCPVNYPTQALSIPTEEIQEIQEIITIIGRRNINNEVGKNLDLSLVNLENFNFAGGNFTKVNFHGSILNNANLNGANFTNTNLVGSELKEVNSTVKGTSVQVKFVNADLTKANLNRARLRNANFTKAKMHDTILISAQLSIAIMIEADLVNAKLDDADLTQANLNRANLDGATLKNANLNGTDLTTTKGLTVPQIEEAKNYQLARYSKEFKAKLKLS